MRSCDQNFENAMMIERGKKTIKTVRAQGPEAQCQAVCWRVVCVVGEVDAKRETTLKRGRHLVMNGATALLSEAGEAVMMSGVVNANVHGLVEAEQCRSASGFGWGRKWMSGERRACRI